MTPAAERPTPSARTTAALASASALAAVSSAGLDGGSAPPTPAASAAPSLGSTEPAVLDYGARRPALFYTPETQGRGPLTVMLHGMCAIPEWECPVFRRGAVSVSFLLCPPGPAACAGSGGMWSGAPKRLKAEVEQATAALARERPDVDTSRKAIIGYSLGATAALRIVSASPGEWQGLMLVNAGLEPAPAEMKKAGVRRVALVAGAGDGSRHKLSLAGKRLASAGIDARFFVLAETGHYFDAKTETRMAEPVAWLLEGL